VVSVVVHPVASASALPTNTTARVDFHFPVTTFVADPGDHGIGTGAGFQRAGGLDRIGSAAWERSSIVYFRFEEEAVMQKMTDRIYIAVLIELTSEPTELPNF
jgi:hypothetical protein